MSINDQSHSITGDKNKDLFVASQFIAQKWKVFKFEERLPLFNISLLIELTVGIALETGIAGYSLKTTEIKQVINDVSSFIHLFNQCIFKW